VLTTSQCKTGLVTKRISVPRVWTDHLIRPKQCKRNKRFGTWNVKSLFRSGSFMMAVRELGRYKLDFVGVQVVRWERGGGHCQIKGL
jgi:hypothetical protein